MLGLHCCRQAFSSCGKWGLLFTAACVFLFAVASLVEELGPRGAWSLVVVAHRLSCAKACGIFPDQGLKLCPLHWQVNSQPLDYQGSQITFLLKLFMIKKYIYVKTTCSF